MHEQNDETKMNDSTAGNRPFIYKAYKNQLEMFAKRAVETKNRGVRQY